MGLFGRLFGGKKKDEPAADAAAAQADAAAAADVKSEPAAEESKPAVEETKPEPSAVQESTPAVEESKPEPKPESAVVAETPAKPDEPAADAGLGSWGSDEAATANEGLGSWGSDNAAAETPAAESKPAPAPEPAIQPAPAEPAAAASAPITEPAPEPKPEPAAAGESLGSWGSDDSAPASDGLGNWGSNDAAAETPAAEVPAAEVKSEPVPEPAAEPELAPEPATVPVPAPETMDSRVQENDSVETPAAEVKSEPAPAPTPELEPAPAPEPEPAPAPVAESSSAESEETGSPWGDDSSVPPDDNPWGEVSASAPETPAPETPALEPAASTDNPWGDATPDSAPAAVSEPVPEPAPEPDKMDSSVRGNDSPVTPAAVSEPVPEPAPEPDKMDSPVRENDNQTTAEPAPVAVSTAGWDDEITGALGMKFKLIKPGRFVMGSPADEPKRNAALEKQFSVEITKPYYIGIYPVTQAEWLSLMDMRVMKFRGDRRPMESVSWKNATQFIAKLNKKADGFVYSLPTEAQWEYACRAGATTAFWNGPSITSDDANILGTVPFPGTKRSKKVGETTDVGAYPPNPWGLYDMHGNVAELCANFLAPYPETNETVKDYAGSERGTEYAVRGGGFEIAPHDSRCASREGITEGNHRAYIGFRLICVKAQ